MKEKKLGIHLQKIYTLGEYAARPLLEWDVADPDGRVFKRGCLGLELEEIIKTRVRQSPLNRCLLSIRVR